MKEKVNMKILFVFLFYDISKKYEFWSLTCDAEQ